VPHPGHRDLDLSAAGPAVVDGYGQETALGAAVAAGAVSTADTAEIVTAELTTVVTVRRFTGAFLRRSYGSGGTMSESSISSWRSKSTVEYSRSFVSRWKPSIIRTVPDFDRITIDWVVHPPER
jgi:hypothetical protein